MDVYIHQNVYACGGENSMHELVLSYSVGPRDQTQIPQLLSQLTSPGDRVSR